MTFGEKMDTFDESRTDLLEFQDVTVNLTNSIAVQTLGAPLYKLFSIYKPTQILSMETTTYWNMVCICSCMCLLHAV